MDFRASGDDGFRRSDPPLCAATATRLSNTPRVFLRPMQVVDYVMRDHRHAKLPSLIRQQR